MWGIYGASRIGPQSVGLWRGNVKRSGGIDREPLIERQRGPMSLSGSKL